MIKIDILQQIIDVHRLLCVFKRITQLMIFNPRNGEIPLRCSFLLYVNIVCIFLQVLRLICIQSYCNNGLKTKVLDYYKREIIQVCVIWFDINTFDKALIIKSWYKSMIDLCKNMYNIVNLQTFNNILELFTILTKGQVLCYEYQHENKGYSKLRYPNVFKQTFTFVTEFLCKLINYFDFFVTNLAS